MEHVLEADSLVRTFSGGMCAVDGLSLKLKRGEVLGFLGPNGAGKSTSMKMLTGNLAPTAGCVRIHGHDLLREPREAKRHLGYLPEVPPLHDELRVREYLHYAARLRGMSGRDARMAVPRVIERCGLESVSNRLIEQLSKGYRQRVGLAQAIIHEPQVIILDEPTVGLDPVQIRSVRELIRELGNEHGVILSSHLLGEVQSVCDRAMIINQGRLVYQTVLDKAGASDDLLELRCRQQAKDAEARLLAVEGVVDVSEASGAWRIEHDAREGLIDAIAELVIREGWGLVSIQPAPADLEQVFVALSRHGSYAPDQIAAEAE
ncbi:MAG: ABC transporter ATP-binding protein [Gammaproteobacteria bacterium]